LLLCLVSRPDEVAPAGRLFQAARAKYHLHYTEIALAPLGRSVSAVLLRSLMGTAALSPRLRETILTRTEGNPFFLEEIIRALIDLGGLVRDPADAAWQATEKAETIAIPDTIQGVIMARIDRLQEDLKQVLTLAAVIGRTFLYRVLQNIATADRELDHHLAELQSLELIREKSRLPELEYFFKHALAQEATYESILLERRRQLHRQVAECIEALFAHRLEEFYGLLAYHYARAEAWEKAQAYLFKVGDQAGRLAADAEALAHYQQAMAAYERAFGERWDPLQRASLERKIGEALFRRGDHDQALNYLHRALGHLDGSPLPTARWQIWAQIARQALRQTRLRLLPARPARPSSDDVAERLRILEAVGWIDFFGDHPERMILHTLSLANDAEQHGLVIDTVKAFATLGIIGDRIPLPRVSAYYHRRAILLADQVAHPVAVAYAYLGLAFHEHHCLGTWPVAVEHYRRAAAAFHSVGDLRRWGAATTGAAFVSSLQGDFMRGLELSHELVRVGTDAGDDQLLGWGEAIVGYVLLRQRGALGEAREHLEKGADLLKSIPDHPDLAITLGFVSQCYLREHRLNEALVVSEECWRLVVDRGLRGFMAALAVGYVAETALAAAESSGRGEGARTAYRTARTMCTAARRQAAISRWGAPIAYRCQGTYHWLRGRPKRAFRWWQRSVAVAETLGARYYLARTHLEIGRRTEDREHLEQAEALYAEIDARSDLAEVRELLRGR
jgi:tetratricopeptide (TPR) repeat protein